MCARLLLSESIHYHLDNIEISAEGAKEERYGGRCCLLIYQESSDISGFFLFSLDAQFLHP